MNFAANKQQNGGDGGVRPDYMVRYQGKQVLASSFRKLPALPAQHGGQEAAVHTDAEATQPQLLPAHANILGSSYTPRGGAAEAASRPSSRMGFVAGATLAPPAQPRTKAHNLDAIIDKGWAAVGPIISLAAAARGTGCTAAAAQALRLWLHGMKHDALKELLKGWGVSGAGSFNVTKCRVSEA